MGRNQTVEADDSSEAGCDVLQREIDRAVVTVRGALSQLAQEHRLHAGLMGMIPLMDNCEFSLIDAPGNSAFEYDQESSTIRFRSSIIQNVIDGVSKVSDEIGYSDREESLYLRQIALNIFVVHEILHIVQNFSDFSAVQDVKNGIPEFGLPSLDAAADIISCSICAVIDAGRQGNEGEDGYLRSFSNCLIIAYAMGTRLFDAREPGKRQRNLGLLMSAMMVQAKAEGRLNQDKISQSWKPSSPILLFNITEANVFNAFVFDEVPALLIKDPHLADQALSAALWESVSSCPIRHSLEMMADLLKQVQVVR